MLWLLLAATTLPGAKPLRLYVINTPLAGVLQDALLATLMWDQASAGYSNLILTHTKSGFDVGLVSKNLSGNVGVGLRSYALKNNCGHVEREGNRLIADAIACGSGAADQKRAHAALASHIRRQNVLAFIALLPGVVAILSQFSGFGRQV